MLYLKMILLYNVHIAPLCKCVEFRFLFQFVTFYALIFLIQFTAVSSYFEQKCRIRSYLFIEFVIVVRYVIL